MKRRDFVLLSSVLRSTHPSPSLPQGSVRGMQHHRDCVAIANAIRESQGPAFDVGRFMDDCGYSLTVSKEVEHGDIT